MATEIRELATPSGLARAHCERPSGVPAGLLALGHGAGGGIAAPDLAAARDAAITAGWAVALVEQPYRVAGRRSPPRAPALDAAWLAAVAAVHAELTSSANGYAALPLVTGGRSSGARVACRTAETAGASGVLCLAFPLLAPARRGTGERPSRQPELDGVLTPVLVVQGDRDPFGMPSASSGREVVAVPADHGLKSPAARAAIAARLPVWLEHVRRANG